jgi:diguanylate cyclase (GGDEF)-like protein/PAS domain S-box-containing protein
MLQFVLHLSSEHDWRLVLLAAALCLLASAVAISLFHRAKATAGRARLLWLILDAATAGYGIWATHFIAMLAYNPAAGAAYDLTLTIVSLLLAVAITGVGFAVAIYGDRRFLVILGGAIVGLGIASMHFVGMRALEMPGNMTWSPLIIVYAIGLGIVFGCLSLFLAARHTGIAGSLAAALALTLGVLFMHFTAMGAMTVICHTAFVTPLASLSATSLSLILGAVAAIVSGMCLVAALSDHRSEQKLNKQKMLLDAALENISQGLCMYDAEGRIVLFNKCYSRMTGKPASALQGRSLLDLLKERHESGDFDADPETYFLGLIAKVSSGGSNSRIWETSDGRTLRVVDHPIKKRGWVSTIEDITDWRDAQAQIAHMARHDALTDLPNRRLFNEQLEQALLRLSRNEQVGVLCLDLDHFKDVNDSLGHPIGDELLNEVAKRLSASVRKGDTVARFGGDEFAIILTGCKSQTSEVAALAGRLVETIAVPFVINGQQIVIGASVGISIAPDDGNDPDQLLKNADMAMYQAKADGRGMYRFFQAGMDAQAQARRLLLTDLRAALLREEFEVYYQPVLDFEADRIVAFEALVRWNHPIRGLILPDDFVPLAEETGLIIPIGDWVLRRACVDAAKWPANISVAVNLSPMQFKNRMLSASVIAALSAAGLPAERLELEITETVLLQDGPSTLATLYGLREFGVRISMDDFGTGYSSLSYLRSFPFDKIKIDQSFVHDLASHGDSMAIIRAVAGLGKSLRIKTLAEGVETSEQLALLRAEGCTQMQGYLFGRPQPASEIADLLANQRLDHVA